MLMVRQYKIVVVLIVDTVAVIVVEVLAVAVEVAVGEMKLLSN